MLVITHTSFLPSTGPRIPLSLGAMARRDTQIIPVCLCLFGPGLERTSSHTHLLDWIHLALAVAMLPSRDVEAMS